MPYSPWKEKKLLSKNKTQLAPIPISITWENLTAHYLTITNYQPLTCAGSLNRIVTPKVKDNKNQNHPHAIIQHSQHNPFNENMEQTSNKFLFLFHHVQLPNKLHTTNCLNTALYTLRTVVLSRYTLFYQGELDPSLSGEKLKEGIQSAIYIISTYKLARSINNIYIYNMLHSK